MTNRVNIVGGGLAGSEAALQLAKRGIKVNLYEMRPKKSTGAHVSGDFAEFVCSNSLGSFDVTNASGLLKKEMELLGGELIKIAYDCSVPAGNALAIDRTLFSRTVTEKIRSNENITVIEGEVEKIPEGYTIMASGPLTSDILSKDIQQFTEEEHLHFFDAIAPIIEKDSINFDIAFYASRYDKGEASYINCPMNKEQYEKFYEFLINAPKIELKEFEKKAKFFESCLPVEVLASRGVDTLRFGPMKPVGLVDKRTGDENYAVVQLRQDNSAKTLYNIVGFQTNLKWGAQKELISLIPGLENANIMRYGVMHRNTFVNSPEILLPTLQTKKRNDLFFAGQITGTEGYTESIATGMLAGINMARLVEGKELLELPTEMMLGALTHYITSPVQKHFQPINSNWAIVKEMEIPKKIRKNKKEKNKILSDRAIEVAKNIIIE
ncbi:TPA: methylenetetrahydrofolate--tRNA-(uracil(54)-C(5))-methyltransferase (FADH(2)-oxidizing) TrmFO [Candidatus Gastranaerophilales bacterium HUM_9]|nr:MAG TPA: methylenetetrahydrofolate--tRNA-(uracil(54)-C(5))-methyltransferase (FADH(2)-oxidizing) TrmFO [Candidatus Gastranaerophilales bacterium HUM_9]HBX35270.1 methylenetetrahydrofolate--tRNA-(uracil(54)-C(5))-methyltransferase (FADH(2)-oxidizing) TrmFO [Cyanobacteria bacterium UBA11440]